MSLSEVLNLAKDLVLAVDEYAKGEPSSGRGRATPSARVGAVRRHKTILEELVGDDESAWRRDDRLFPVAFVAEQVEAGAEVDIEVKPQATFTGKRLAIPNDIAAKFDIVDVKVGKESQLVATSRIPAIAFAMDASDKTMELDTCRPGLFITLRVVNKDKVPRNFQAVMYGAVRD